MVAFGPASPISLLTFTAPLLPQLLNSYFLHSFLNQLVSATLQYQLYNIILEHLPAPPDAIMPDHSSETEMMSIEIDLDTEADSNDERLRGGTATLPFNPLTGAIIPSPQPIDIDPLELEADSSSETESHPVRTSTPPAPPTRPQSPPFRAEPSSSGPLPLRRATSLADAPTHPVHAHRQEYRRTTLAGHPADIAASHISDCATNAVLLIWESAMLRTLARPRAWRRAVYAPFEILGPGQELLTKAVVVGEWGMLWLLFEGSVVTSTWMGVRWFGYARGL